MSNRLLATLSFFAAAATAAAAPLFDEPVAEVHFVNGDVLHNVQAKSFNSTSVLIKFSEGAKTVPYDQFPADLRPLVLARKPAPHPSNSAAKPIQIAKSVDKPKKAAEVDRLQGDRFKGLALLSTTPGTHPDYMGAEIYNDNVEPVTIEPGSLQAELDNGKLVIGRHFVSTDEQGNINVTLKSAQEVPPKSTVHLLVTFAVPPEVTITRVAWSQN